MSSGKKKPHTRKSQVAINAITGAIGDIATSVPGPTADITLVAQAGLLARLPPGGGARGDLADVGRGKLHALGTAPRRKPRGQARPPAAIAYNRAFARRRLPGAHTIGQLRASQALTQTARQHRCHHTARVRAVAGRVNRRLQRLAAYRARLAA